MRGRMRVCVYASREIGSEGGKACVYAQRVSHAKRERERERKREKERVCMCK